MRIRSWIDVPAHFLWAARARSTHANTAGLSYCGTSPICSWLAGLSTGMTPGKVVVGRAVMACLPVSILRPKEKARWPAQWPKRRTYFAAINSIFVGFRGGRFACVKLRPHFFNRQYANTSRQQIIESFAKINNGNTRLNTHAGHLC